MASTTQTFDILTGLKSVEGSIRYAANHSLVPASQILEEAQAYIWQRLRIREMQVTVSVPLLISTSSVAAPDGYLAPVKLMIDGLGELAFKREKTFPDFRDDTGALAVGDPTCWTVIGTTIYFDTTLVQALTGRLTYYGQPAALAANNQTNVLTDRFPTLLRRCCLAFAYESRSRDGPFQTEIGLVEQAIMDANMQDEMARTGQVL